MVLAGPACCLRQLLGGPNRGWHAVAARILGVSMAEAEKGILIIHEGSWSMLTLLPL